MGLLQDGPLLVICVHQALHDVLCERLDGEVWPGLGCGGRFRADKPPS
jgi:hypothetical protein